MSDDFDDDSKTPQRPSYRPLTDSERQVFRAHWESGTPSVIDPNHEDTSPIDLFERAPRHGHGHLQSDIVRRLRDDPKQLIPFVGELAEWVVGKMRERSSSEQDALKELRELLSKPPNGRTKALEEQVKGLERAVSELAEALEAIQEERKDESAKAVEADKAATSGKWKAVLAIVTTLLGSAGAVIATLRSASEEKGRAEERAATMRRDIDELRSARHPRPGDYDYDIAPQREPRHTKKDNEP